MVGVVPPKFNKKLGDIYTPEELLETGILVDITPNYEGKTDVDKSLFKQNSIAHEQWLPGYESSARLSRWLPSFGPSTTQNDNE